MAFCVHQGLGYLQNYHGFLAIYSSLAVDCFFLLLTPNTIELENSNRRVILLRLAFRQPMLGPSEHYSQKKFSIRMIG